MSGVYTRYFGQGLLGAILLLYGFCAAFSVTALFLPVGSAQKVLDRIRRMGATASGLSIVALVVLGLAFAGDDFSIALVAEYSSTQLPILYKLSALWAGSAGSLLVWAVMLFVCLGVWMRAVQDWPVKVRALGFAIGSAVAGVFAALLVYFAKPFAGSGVTLDEGYGLNPLLQNFWMVIHPPLLFAGYSLFLIPFVVSLAGAFTGWQRDVRLYRQVRRWLLAALCFLSLGIATGSKWSYVELGWGGYWAWDPVENASMLPWLVAMAALHGWVGLRFSERFRFWAFVLSPVPFVLCLFATFITRSGVLASVHAFGQSVMSSAVLVLIGLCFLSWIWAMVRLRRDVGVGAPQLGAPIMSMEGLLFWAGLIMVVLACVVALATFWPLLRAVFTGSSSGLVLTREFYDRVASVAGIVLALQLGVCMLAVQRRRGGFVLFVMLAAAAGLITYWLVLRVPGTSVLTALACAMCAFSVVGIAGRVMSCLAAPSRVGAAVAHLGLVVLIVAAGAACQERVVQTQLRRGDSFTLGGYRFTYESFEHRDSGGRTMVGPRIVLSRGDLRKSLWPHNSLYPGRMRGSEDNVTSEVAVYSSWLEDVYLSFDGLGEENAVVLTARIKPFMRWIWVSAVLIVFGIAVAGLFAGGRGRGAKASEALGQCAV